MPANRNKLMLGLPDNINYDDIVSCSDLEDAECKTSEVTKAVNKEINNLGDTSESLGLPLVQKADDRSNGDTKSSNDTATENFVPYVSNGYKNVSRHLFEKFRNLEKKIDASTQKTTQRRIKLMQNKIMERIEAGFSNPNDRRVLGIYGVTLDCLSEKPKTTNSEEKIQEDPVKVDDMYQHDWLEVKKYYSINSHLDNATRGPNYGIETQIDRAVTSGNVARAEELSDHLATRQLGEKIAAAFDAKRFLEDKEKEEYHAACKRKKLNWTFDHKQRWETKGNM